MRDEQLTVTLSHEQADFVREEAERRGNASPDDVVAEAVTLLRQKEQDLARIRAELDAASSDPRRYSIDEVRARLTARIRTERAPS